MRPKFVLTVTVLAVLVLVAAFYIRHHSAQSQSPAGSETATAPVPAANGDLAAASHSASRSKPASATVVAPMVAASAVTSEQKQAYIEDEISRLQELSMKDDSASLTAILNDVTNSEKAIRLAAIEAAKQFGSRDAIPTLKADVANTPDINEQIALLEAAHFLSLPTIADSDVQIPPTSDQIQAAQQRRDRAVALKQARMEQHAQSRNPQAGPNH